MITSVCQLAARAVIVHARASLVTQAAFTALMLHSVVYSTCMALLAKSDTLALFQLVAAFGRWFTVRCLCAFLQEWFLRGSTEIPVLAIRSSPPSSFDAREYSFKLMFD